MRTGIKTLARKIIHKISQPTFLYPQTPTKQFPNMPACKFKIKTRLFGIKNEIREAKVKYNFGSLYTLPHPLTIKAYQTFLKYNPNHLGNWSIKEPKYGTQQLEYEVIQKMINLYHATKQKIEGYITSGGTEGNIFSLWLGRTYLEKKCTKNTICLLRTNLTHYSIRKAGHICNVPQFLIPLDSKNWNIEITGLAKKIKLLYKMGYRGFLLPLTFAYTTIGTKDDIQKTVKIVKKIQKEYKNIHFYIWIDAAINGLIEPFIKNNFAPFKSKLIQSFVVDFHKFGLTPYPSGIVLYRKKMRKLIEKPVEYLQEKDQTLLGSRPGASSASIWAAIHLLGKKQYKNIIQKGLQNKNYFIKHIQKEIPKAKIIYDKNSLSCGVIFYPFSRQRLPKKIEERYWLFPTSINLLFNLKKKEKHIIYTFFFLPHIKRRTINHFLSDLKQ